MAGAIAHFWTTAMIGHWSAQRRTLMEPFLVVVFVFGTQRTSWLTLSVDQIATGRKEDALDIPVVVCGVT